VFAWTAAGDVPSEAARCVVVVGEPPGPPPPKPPDPPADPLAAEFRNLLAADPSADRLAHLAQLDVRTAGDLAGRIRAASGTLLPADALVAVRKRIAEEIAKHLPVETDAPLDPSTRRKAALLFARIATSLEAAK
jgi:hypothetical protein